MLESNMKIQEALTELRKTEKRKFIQTVDLIINLQKFDVRKESINTFITLPHVAERRICAFLTRKSPLVDTIIKEDFDKFKEDADMKRFANKYDAFIAVASLMPTIATKFGRVLGPLGKMPSPQAGIVPLDNDESIKAMLEKLKKMKRIRTKERSIKIAIGKESMSDKEVEDNVNAVVKAVEALLPRKNDNIKDVMLKFTMTKAIKL
jgi:large subunit ribosomal protein L1